MVRLTGGPSYKNRGKLGFDVSDSVSHGIRAVALVRGWYLIERPVTELKSVLCLQIEFSIMWIGSSRD